MYFLHSHLPIPFVFKEHLEKATSSLFRWPGGRAVKLWQVAHGAGRTASAGGTGWAGLESRSRAPDLKAKTPWAFRYRGLHACILEWFQIFKVASFFFSITWLAATSVTGSLGNWMQRIVTLMCQFLHCLSHSFGFNGVYKMKIPLLKCKRTWQGRALVGRGECLNCPWSGSAHIPCPSLWEQGWQSWEASQSRWPWGRAGGGMRVGKQGTSECLYRLCFTRGSG